MSCTYPVEDRIAQFDGNDTLDNTEDTTIANANGRNVKTRVAEFELNKAKQTAGICKDALLQDFKLVHKDQDKNINIECSSGFYHQVAKPTLCSLSQDFIPPILGSSIFCSNITKNTDAHGYEYSLTMFFKISQDNGNSTKVTIHAHHSARLVQIQGGAALPDKSTSALWFVRNVLYGKFQVLAEAKCLSISRINEAITSLAGPSSNSSKTKCGSCDIPFDSRSKPVYCVRCVLWFHKTNCHRAHRCGTALPPHVAGPSTSRDDQVSPADRDASSLPARQVLPALTASSAPSTPVTTTAALVSLARSTSIETYLAPSAMHVSAPSTLNPNAHQFLPQPPPNMRRPRQTQNVSSFTPEKAEIESLKIELSYARTKIVDLQTKSKDQEHTIEIYSQKIKLLEDSRLDALHSKYFSSTSSNPNPPSDTSWSSDCPCKIRAQIIRNGDNLKDMELRFSMELEQVRKRLEDITRSTAPPPPQSTQSPPTTTSTPMQSHSPQPRQPPVSPETYHFQDIDLRSTAHPTETSNTLETGVDDEISVGAVSESVESEYEFSESFNFNLPENSPRISLN